MCKRYNLINYHFSSFLQKHLSIHLSWAIMFSFNNSKSTFNKITLLKGNRPTNLLGPILPKADTDSLLLQYLETLVLIEFPASLNSFYSFFFSKTTLSSSLCSINSIGFLNSIFRKVKEEARRRRSWLVLQIDSFPIPICCLWNFFPFLA